jgi:hypothetical protein
MRPRRLAGVGVRPLNVTVRQHARSSVPYATPLHRQLRLCLAAIARTGGSQLQNRIGSITLETFHNERASRHAALRVEDSCRWTFCR